MTQPVKSIKPQVHQVEMLEGLYGLLAFNLNEREER